MNTINAQVEVLKEALKGKSKHRCLYGTFNDTIIIGNAIKLYCIPKTECAINLSNIENVTILSDTTLQNILNDSDCKQLKLTNELQIVDNKTTLRVFKNDIEKKYVDENLLKNFDLMNSTFMSIPKSPIIYIYEDWDMKGLVLATKFNGGINNDL